MSEGLGHDKRRRIVLASAGIIAGFAAAPARGAERAPDIVQPAQPGPAGFMARALEMRRRAAAAGDQAYGAVIVKSGRIVGEGVSAVLTRRDPTAHAEIEAIRDAARRLGTNDLTGCEMYGTSKACPMCETAAYWARLARLHYGESVTDGGAPRYGGC